MDIAAGYCEFINNIDCRKKYAVDINPDVGKFADKNVEIIATKSINIPQKFNGKIDVVFMSNFLEHLSSKEEIILTLEKCHSVLKPRGKIMIMQPNISLIGNDYWNFIDHKMPLNTASAIEALEIAGFKIDYVIEKFLPYTTKSRLSVFSNFLRVYLLIPHQIRPFAGQSFFIASKK